MSDSKKVVPPKGKKTHTEMLLDPSLREGGYRNVRRRSALDDEFEAEEDSQARELRDLRTKKLVLKREAEVAKLEREIKEAEGSPTETRTGEAPKLPGISITTARQIAALPEDERTRVLETYMLMQAAEAKQANAVLPAIVGFARANPGSSQNSMVEYAKLANEQLKTGIELARGNEPKTPPDVWKPVELVMDLVKESVKEPLDRMSQSMQPQQGFFETLLLNKDLFDRAKDLGIFGGRHEGGGGTTDMDLKIAEITTANTLEMKKLDLEWKKDMLKRESEDRRTDALLTALAPLSAIVAGPVNQRMREFGRQQAASHMPPGVVSPLKIMCSCGYQGLVPDTGAKTTNCPKCGIELVIGGAPGVNGNPEKSDTGT